MDNLHSFHSKGSGWKCDYKERVKDNKIIITAKMELDKNSKTAMNRFIKADEKTSSALLLLLQEEYRDIRKNINEGKM